MLPRRSFFPANFFPFLFASLAIVLIGLFSAGKTGGWFGWIYRSVPAVFSLSGGGKKNKPPSSAGRTAQLLLENGRLAEENERSRKLLGANPPLDFKFEPTFIIGSRGGRIRLAGGRDKGFTKDLPVVGTDSFLGKIVSVQAYTSVVRLVSDRDFRLAVSVWRPDKSGKKSDLTAKGLLKGGRQPVVEEVGEEETVKKGFLVAPLGLPGRFFVGRVKAVSSPRGGFKKFSLDWQGKRDILGTVFVVKNAPLP